MFGLGQGLVAQAVLVSFFVGLFTS